MCFTNTSEKNNIPKHNLNPPLAPDLALEMGEANQDALQVLDDAPPRSNAPTRCSSATMRSNASTRCSSASMRSVGVSIWAR